MRYLIVISVPATAGAGVIRELEQRAEQAANASEVGGIEVYTVLTGEDAEPETTPAPQSLRA